MPSSTGTPSAATREPSLPLPRERATGLRDGQPSFTVRGVRRISRAVSRASWRRRGREVSTTYSRRVCVCASIVVHCLRRAKNFPCGIEGELETKRKGGFNDVFSPRVCPRALGTHAVQHRHAQRGHEGAVASAAASARPKRVALACGTGLREGQPPFTVRGRARSA